MTPYISFGYTVIPSIIEFDKSIFLRHVLLKSHEVKSQFLKYTSFKEIFDKIPSFNNILLNSTLFKLLSSK